MADVSGLRVPASAASHAGSLSEDGTGTASATSRGIGKSPAGGLSLSDKFMRSLSSNPASTQTDSRRDSATQQFQSHSHSRQSLLGSHLGHDPLAQTILERASAESVDPKKARAQALAALDGNSDLSSPVRSSFSMDRRGNANDDSAPGSLSKDKKKGSSFLSRLRPGGKKRDSLQGDRPEDSPDDPDESRAEGAEAAVFSQPIGYIPKFPEPPRYIKVKARGKKVREFDRVFLAQELRGRTGLEVAQAGGHRINVNAKTKHGDAIWAMEFSRDGRYLAAGGHNHLVRIWSVIASEADRREEERTENVKLSAPVFKSKPIQEYEGHTSSILALSWSKNNFLLSSSMDKTVRLWHVSRAECLCVFKHPDFVPTVQFHPQDDRFFLAGSLDSRLRLWSIPDKNVAYSTQVNDLITAIAFTPDGKTVMAGTLNGLCIFYDTEKLREQTRMHVRSAHGKNAKGSKITGIQAINYPPNDPKGDIKLLITSNDSRIRLYNFRDKSLELKLKGNENTTSQIRATFSDDGKKVISGSEDKKCFIWDLGRPDRDREKHPMEVFEAHNDIVTAAIMAPARTRQLLQASGDPVFEICNPPPVQLVSKDNKSAGSASVKSSAEENGEDVNTPTAETMQLPPAPAGASSGFLARSSHPSGHIIITADVTGRVKCFRSDCAWKNRQKNNESWDTASTFSKKVLHRSSSIATRASRNSASFRDSFVYPSGNDRILSWRQSIDQSRVPTNGYSATDMARSPSLRARNGRSGSPMKAMAAGGLPANMGLQGKRLSSFASYRSRDGGDGASAHPLSTSVTHTPALSTAGASAQSLHSIASSPLGGSDGAATDANGRNRVLKASDLSNPNPHGQGPADQRAAARRRGDDGGPARDPADEPEGDEDEERCRACGGESFKAVRLGRGRRGTRLECTSCGLAVE